MNKLCSEFDRARASWIVNGVNSSAHAVSGFEDTNLEARSCQLSSGRKTRYSRTDDGDIKVHTCGVANDLPQQLGCSGLVRYFQGTKCFSSHFPNSFRRQNLVGLRLKE